MVARSMFAVCVTAMLAVTGCAAAAGPEEDDGADVTSAELKMQSMDDVPVPGPVDVPVLDLARGLRRPAWDLRRYFDDYAPRRVELGGCFRYELNVYDPSKGHDVPIAVTVCN